MKNLNDEEREIIRKTRKYVENNRRYSAYAVAEASVLFLVASLSTLFFESSLLKLLFSILAGLILMRCFVLYHDFLHGSILRRSKWADIVFRLFSIILLTPKSVWKETHNYHHTHNSKLASSHIGSYKIVSTDKWDKMTLVEKIEYKWIRHPVNMLCGMFTVFFIGMIVTPLLRNYKKNLDALIIGIAFVALSTTLFMSVGFGGAFFALWLPQLVAGALGSYLFYVQHNFPSVHFQPLTRWSYVDAALSSSCFIDMPPLMHWFTANIGYHHIHHLNPMIPFYRLPEVMRDVPELKPRHTTTLSFSNIKKAIALKLWNENKQAMEGY